MNTPGVDKKLRRAVFWIVLIGLSLLIGLTVLGTVVWVKAQDAFHYLDSKPTRQVLERQPIYTTIQGLPGLRGETGPAGQNSVSTQTVIEKQTTIVQQTPGEKGDKGDDGPGMKLKFVNGVLFWQYDGDREWQEVPQETQ